MTAVFERALLTEVEDALSERERALYSALRRTVWVLVSSTTANPEAAATDAQYQPVQLSTRFNKLRIVYRTKFDGQLLLADGPELIIGLLPKSRSRGLTFEATIGGPTWRRTPVEACRAATAFKKCGELGAAALEDLNGVWAHQDVKEVSATIERWEGLLLPSAPYAIWDQ